MKLSLWHCEVLYIMTRLSLAEVVKLAGVDGAIALETANRNNWHWKKEKYKGLNDSQQFDLSVIELLIGEFKQDDSHFNFVNLVLEKRRQRENELREVQDGSGETEGLEPNLSRNGSVSGRGVSREQVKEQYAAILTEYGMDERAANEFIGKMETELIGSKSEGEFIGELVGEVASTGSVTVRDKLDTVNAGYKLLMEGHDKHASHIHNDLRKRIGFYAKMLDMLENKMPQAISFEELANLQRTISYAAASYSKLVQLQFEIGGLKGFVNYESTKARILREGYMLIPRDEMGRLIQSDN